MMKRLAILFALVFAMAVARAETVIEVDVNVNVAPEGEVTISSFYESLSPHGKWIQDETYGWVFQPTVVVQDAEWRPYCHGGRWVHTEHGWYWQSDYEWGWAAFHYGRWHRHGHHRWVWVPDTVWAPAWVQWREGDSHYGWAPLPPTAVYVSGVGFSYRGKNVAVGFGFGLAEVDYTFVPHRHFLSVNLVGSCIGRPHVTKIYNTTIIRNTYVTRNKYVVNEGFDRRVVEKRTETTIVTKRVRDIRRGRISERSNERTIRTYRPEVSNKKPLDPPSAIKHRNERHQRRNQVEQPRAPRRIEQRPLENRPRVAPQPQRHHEPRQPRVAPERNERRERVAPEQKPANPQRAEPRDHPRGQKEPREHKGPNKEERNH